MSFETVISSIDAEIKRLTEAKALLVASLSSHQGKAGAKPAPQKRGHKRTLSADARKRIADAQRRRWAKAKKAK